MPKNVDQKSLPNLIMPGVQKSGTTYLANLMQQHPDIFVPKIKEPTHFIYRCNEELNYPSGDVIKSAFSSEGAYNSLFEGQNEVKWRLDASTSYFYKSNIRKKIHEVCPNAKIIIALRDPVGRAYSAFNYHKQLTFESVEDFDEAISLEQERIEKNVMALTPYIKTGFYFSPIQEWMDLFGRENVHVVLFDDIRDNIDKCMLEICEFLEIDPIHFEFESDSNTSVITKSRFKKWVINRSTSGKSYDTPLRRMARQLLGPELRAHIRAKVIRPFVYSKSGSEKPKKLSDELKASLTPQYQADIEALSELIGRDLSHWLIK